MWHPERRRNRKLQFETGLGELTSKDAIKTYLDTYTSDWKMKDPDDITAEVDFDQEANAVLLWAKKIS